MKTLFTCCALCCFMAWFKWPIEYYIFLRIIIFVGSTTAIIRFLSQKMYAWAFIFLLFLVLFNPFYPFYLHRKSLWLPFDFAIGSLFLWLACVPKRIKVREEINIPKTYRRDRIITTKTLIQKEK